MVDSSFNGVKFKIKEKSDNERQIQKEIDDLNNQECECLVISMDDSDGYYYCEKCKKRVLL
jgi:hypothetical protein